MSEHAREYTLKDMIRLFRCFDGFGVPHESLWWRTDTQYAPVTMIVNCNDLFFWGCSDCESIGPDELPDLEKAIEDARAATGDDPDNAHYLWIARKRGMRPQGAFYKYFDEKMRPLFDACGPEREIGLGNPEANTALPNAATPRPAAQAPEPGFVRKDIAMTKYRLVSEPTGMTAEELGRRIGMRGIQTDLGTLLVEPPPFNWREAMAQIDRALHPTRCICGTNAVLHQPNCPAASWT